MRKYVKDMNNQLTEKEISMTNLFKKMFNLTIIHIETRIYHFNLLDNQGPKSLMHAMLAKMKRKQVLYH